MSSLAERKLDQEFDIKAVRSSGPGGQHVNKTSTRVELRFNVGASDLLTEDEKNLIRNNLSSMLTRNDDLLITSEKTRSQAKNREDAIEKFYRTLEKALTPAKKRKKTKPPPEVKEKRLEEKKKQSEKKSLRKPPED
ncbi:MAG: alternative ribosome rescue aminoacyl-tRNA hydrolase ArfB [Bacteroidales bacterium]